MSQVANIIGLYCSVIMQLMRNIRIHLYPVKNELMLMDFTFNVDFIDLHIYDHVFQ